MGRPGSSRTGEVARFLAAELTEEVERRLAAVHSLVGARERSVADARRHVEAMPGFEVFCHTVYRTLHAAGHSEAEGAESAAHHHG